MNMNVENAMVQALSPVDQLVQPSSGLSFIESCHSIWVLDDANRRFRRLLRGARLDAPVATEWRPYHHAVLDEGTDAFLIYLDRAGSRLLRSWRHLVGRCERCGQLSDPESLASDLNRFEMGLDTELV